ncbi:50S ribosomal protein L5 [Candidatus Dojkabacteria bacterium]|nr:50S ribosomal protein L5 [Candidatus Dojkabacteria bacterium]
MKLESQLKKQYLKKYRQGLKEELELENINAVPNLEKIVINSGIGEAKENPELIDELMKDFTILSGQKPVVTKSKESISNFKVKEGMPIGLKVTLRGMRMWAFLEKLIHIVLPRVKDFRGLSRKSFDGAGNYSMGLKEQLVFPEIDSTKVKKRQGMQIVICTTADNNEAAEILLEKFNFPFVKQ